MTRILFISVFIFAILVGMLGVYIERSEDPNKSIGHFLRSIGVLKTEKSKKYFSEVRREERLVKERFKDLTNERIALMEKRKEIEKQLRENNRQRKEDLKDLKMKLKEAPQYAQKELLEHQKELLDQQESFVEKVTNEEKRLREYNQNVNKQRNDLVSEMEQAIVVDLGKNSERFSQLEEQRDKLLDQWKYKEQGIRERVQQINTQFKDSITRIDTNQGQFMQRYKQIDEQRKDLTDNLTEAQQQLREKNEQLNKRFKSSSESFIDQVKANHGKFMEYFHQLEEQREILRQDRLAKEKRLKETSKTLDLNYELMKDELFERVETGRLRLKERLESLEEQREILASISSNQAQQLREKSVQQQDQVEDFRRKLFEDVETGYERLKERLESLKAQREILASISSNQARQLREKSMQQQDQVEDFRRKLFEDVEMGYERLKERLESLKAQKEVLASISSNQARQLKEKSMQQQDQLKALRNRMEMITLDHKEVMERFENLKEQQETLLDIRKTFEEQMKERNRNIDTQHKTFMEGVVNTLRTDLKSKMEQYRHAEEQYKNFLNSLEENRKKLRENNQKTEMKLKSFMEKVTDKTRLDYDRLKEKIKQIEDTRNNLLVSRQINEERFKETNSRMLEFLKSFMERVGSGSTATKTNASRFMEQYKQLETQHKALMEGSRDYEQQLKENNNSLRNRFQDLKERLKENAKVDFTRFMERFEQMEQQRESLIKLTESNMQRLRDNNQLIATQINSLSGNVAESVTADMKNFQERMNDFERQRESMIDQLRLSERKMRENNQQLSQHVESLQENLFSKTKKEVRDLFERFQQLEDRQQILVEQRDLNEQRFRENKQRMKDQLKQFRENLIANQQADQRRLMEARKQQLKDFKDRMDNDSQLDTIREKQRVSLDKLEESKRKIRENAELQRRKKEELADLIKRQKERLREQRQVLKDMMENK